MVEIIQTPQILDKLRFPTVSEETRKKWLARAAVAGVVGASALAAVLSVENLSSTVEHLRGNANTVQINSGESTQPPSQVKEVRRAVAAKAGR